jgi:hypothetical protein
VQLLSMRATDAQPVVGDFSQAAWGDWKDLHATRFPNNNLTTITQRISAAGFTPGLWMAPLTADLHSTLAAEHPDWILRQVRTLCQYGGLCRGAYTGKFIPLGRVWCCSVYTPSAQRR